MGVAIVAGFAVIALTIAMRVGGDDTGSSQDAEGPWRQAVEVPQGCALSQADVAEDQLLLRLEGPQDLGCQKLLLLDSGSGEIVGIIDFGENLGEAEVPAQ